MQEKPHTLRLGVRHQVPEPETLYTQAQGQFIASGIISSTCFYLAEICKAT